MNDESLTVPRITETRPVFPFSAALVFLAASAVMLWRRELSDVQPPPALPSEHMELAKIEKISTPTSFDELCGHTESSDWRFDACRRKLPVFGKTRVWLDTDLLLRKGERLDIEHLGILYGVTGSENEATRLALAAILSAECRRGRLPAKHASFEKLLEPQCRGKLPSLASLGLEIDEHWLAPTGNESDSP